VGGASKGSRESDATRRNAARRDTHGDDCDGQGKATADSKEKVSTTTRNHWNKQKMMFPSTDVLCHCFLLLSLRVCVRVLSGVWCHHYFQQMLRSDWWKPMTKTRALTFSFGPDIRCPSTVLLPPRCRRFGATEQPQARRTAAGADCRQSSKAVAARVAAVTFWYCASEKER